MQQVMMEVLLPLFISVYIFAVAFIIGNFIFDTLKWTLIFDELFKTAISFLLGCGILANVGLLLSLVNALNIYTVWIVSSIVFVVGHRRLVCLLKNIKCFLNSINNFSFENLIFLFSIVFLFLFYLVSAFTPPYLNDAIAYHLPEAIQISNGDLLSLTGFGVWSGNMPLLMETFYAFLYKIGGFNVINLIHYGMFLTIVLFVYSFLKREFNSRSGLFGLIFIFAFHPLSTHATSAYIDAGTLAFELVGALLFFLWVKYRDKNLLLLSGSMFGLSLATKYTPLYTLIVVGILFLFFSIKNNFSWKYFLANCVYFCAPILLFGGFWYIKNFILLGNPVYPFIFGHTGFSDEALASVAFDVRYFTGRPIVHPSIINFVLIPYKFFWSPYYLTLLFSFLVFPLGFLIKKNTTLLRIMMVFSFCYFTIWFFFISNNIHYGLIGPVVLMMVSAVVISRLTKQSSQFISHPKAFKVFVVLAFLLFFGFIAGHRKNYVLQMKKTEIEYSLGIINASEFYRRNQLGEIFEISQYINNNFSTVKIVDNWNGFSIFLKNGNEYVTLSDYASDMSDVSWITVCSFLKNKNIQLLSINYALRERVVNDSWNKQKGTDAIWTKLRDLDTVITANSKVIFNKYNGSLYLINSCNK